MLITIGDPVFDDVGLCVDGQLGHTVLLLVLTLFTLFSFSTISSSMFTKRLIVSAYFGSSLFSNSLTILILRVRVLVAGLDYA